MKNKWILWIAPFVFLIILWATARITGMLQMYTLSTPSSEPTIQRGSIVFSSILKSPKQDNFIAFKSDYFDPRTDFSTRGELHIFRIAGMEADIIEMKDGILFRNKINVDFDKNLLYNYIVDAEFVSALPNRIELEEKGYLRAITPTTFEIYSDYSGSGIVQ